MNRCHPHVRSFYITAPAGFQCCGKRLVRVCFFAPLKAPHAALEVLVGTFDGFRGMLLIFVKRWEMITEGMFEWATVPGC